MRSGRSFAVSGMVLLTFGFAAPLAAQPARRAPRAEATIDEMAAPRREDYDRIIMQLPPLTPVRHGAQKAAPAVAPPAPAETPVAAEAPAQPSPAVAVDAPTAPQSERALQTEAPVQAVREIPPMAEPAPMAESAPAAEPAPMAEAAPLVEAASPPAVEAADAPPAAAPSVAAPAAAPEATEQAAPVAELPPPPALPPEEEQSSGSWTDWALLLAFVAIGGLFAARRWKARRRPAPAPAPVVAPPPAEAKRGRLAVLLVVIREKGAPAALALIARLRNLRRPESARERDAEKVAEWAQISATLRARSSSAVASAPQPEEAPGVVSEPPTAKADARRWDQDRDGVELLEPGSPGARALVMNARRKLQTVGQR
ncbi:hypothetical protein Ms3S1_04110 [Methylosinus sp. 3S-1]